MPATIKLEIEMPDDRLKEFWQSVHKFEQTDPVNIHVRGLIDSPSAQLQELISFTMMPRVPMVAKLTKGPELGDQFEQVMNSIVAAATNAWTDYRLAQILIDGYEITDTTAKFAVVVEAKRR